MNNIVTKPKHGVSKEVITILDEYHNGWMDAPIESNKWRNIVFDKSGKSYRGHGVWPSEETALRAMNSALRERDAGITQVLSSLDGDLDWEIYSYNIQLPVKD